MDTPLMDVGCQEVGQRGFAPGGHHKAKMNQAVATYESMKQAHESGAEMPAAVPAGSVPVDSAPVAAEPSAVSAADLTEAKKQ
eukprot:10855369-Heterocapsa_arctica.AAC.1